METVRFTQNDLAKYPFLKETAVYMKKLNLKIEELENPEMGRILNRAEERVKNAILSVSVGEKRENYVEIPHRNKRDKTVQKTQITLLF